MLIDNKSTHFKKGIVARKLKKFLDLTIKTHKLLSR